MESAHFQPSATFTVVLNLDPALAASYTGPSRQALSFEFITYSRATFGCDPDCDSPLATVAFASGKQTLPYKFLIQGYGEVLTPEPATSFLSAFGLAVVGLYRRRKV